MMEVAHNLEGIHQILKEGLVSLQKQDNREECNSIEGAESHDFSSISEIMHFDTITPYSPDGDRPLPDEP